MLWRLITRVFVAAGAGAVPAQVADPDAGRDIFMSYCVQCHGFDAEGAGPMAELLNVVTPDLTVLAKGNGGVFPIADVAMKIDGRTLVLAHGGDMPLFGPFFDIGTDVTIRLPSGQSMMMSQTLADLISYLEALQKQ
ncbi:c-type cytochrome [Aliiruegeria sabulilitoris]|uniref:c-type cytochrome n=1 Tax=Aliiruegeria sabulilitoris TaxID=1510458 RepID=UPI0008355C90|nr:cytochrome c [Aliiruegeria sabulilitoris]NDR55344.1 c-type cytochrome [Pseudoruegeria sp. M32A2M]